MIALPLFIYFFFNGDITVALVVFGLAMATDVFDGYIARKLRATSTLGAYFDAATDFIFVLGLFAAFTINNYYSPWMLLLIVASFAQFLASSLYTKRLYDPLGKYIGSVLYLAIALSLLFPATLTFFSVEISFSLFAITSFILRTASFTMASRKNHFTPKLELQHPKSNTS